MNPSVYAMPVMPRIVVRPLLATLLLHGLAIWLMTVNWSASDREVTRVKPVPKAINARLVDVSEFRPKPKPKPKPQPKKPPAPAAKPKPKPEPVAKVEPKPVPKPRPVAAKPKPQPAAEPAPRPKAEPRISAAELAAIARAELEDAVAAEETATAQEMAASYAALIQSTVINYWSRPPSARNGMEALLSIQLVPTGEVVSVQVLRSSGNSAFDRSAVHAVEKAGAFPELQQLPGREFEKTFRRFRLLFRPEDLRY